ncbi:MAG: cytochrome c3 family protein [Calditrichia bacterium]
MIITKSYIKIVIILTFLFILPSVYLASQENEGTEVTCTSAGCHGGLVADSIVHEAASDDCESCHESDGNNHPGDDGNEFSLSNDPPELCYDCHDEKNQKQNIHPPVDDGECLECHNPHSSETPALLVETNLGDLCGTCHDVEKEENMLAHEPVKKMDCISCHNPHQSDFSTLLKQNIPQLCFLCHTKEEEQESFSNVHPVFEDECLECHKPHFSSFPSLLTAEIPQLCFRCHDDIETSFTENDNKHKPFETGKCLSCHSPHATKNKALLVDGEAETCFLCHGYKNKWPDMHTDNIQARVSQSNYVHDPVADGECTLCHLPHTSRFPFLLNSAFPEGSYTKDGVASFALCFDCHDQEMIEEPVTKNATEFRDDDKNLHYLHVNREKGRSCINCHNIHGADFPHLINKKSKFGKWKMPIIYKVNENGATCLPGCHEEKTYQR